MDIESIYTACLTCLAKNDINSLSLSRVADMLGIKKSSLYFYCKNKDDLISKSIKYAENYINISNFKLDLTLEVPELFFKVFEHYYKVFSSFIPRCYLSCITRISDYELSGFMTLEDVIYTFETQVSVILFSLVENKKLSLDVKAVDNISHIIALLIFEMISQSESKDKADWHISKSIEIIKQLIQPATTI